MTRVPRCVTGAVMGDPQPDRLVRAEALRRTMPEPRPEQPLSEWLVDTAPEWISESAP